MRKVFLIVGVVTALIAVSSPAMAHKQEVSDPNDTPGKLDIEKATSIDRGSGLDEKFIFIVKTHGAWRKRHLAGGEGNFKIQFRRGQESSYQIEIRTDKSGDLTGLLVLCIEAQGCNYDKAQTVPVRKRNERVVKTWVKREDIPGVGNNLRWRATSAYGTGCDGNCHFDLAPNHGLEHHEV